MYFSLIWNWQLREPCKLQKIKKEIASQLSGIKLIFYNNKKWQIGLLIKSAVAHLIYYDLWRKGKTLLVGLRLSGALNVEFQGKTSVRSRLYLRGEWGFGPPICSHIGWTGPGEPTEEGEMNKTDTR